MGRALVMLGFGLGFYFALLRPILALIPDVQ
jgi:hypothetical protein